jgi:hypothetical protein
MFGTRLVRAFEEFKGIWDPDDGMNPGKVVRPRRLDQDLRHDLRLQLGPQPVPSEPIRSRKRVDAGRFWG